MYSTYCSNRPTELIRYLTWIWLRIQAKIFYDREMKWEKIQIFYTVIRIYVPALCSTDIPSHCAVLAVLWNRNYFLRFRFRLLKSYGSGSDFSKVGFGTGTITFQKSDFWKVTAPVQAPYLYHKKQIFCKKFVYFLQSKLFYKEKDDKYQQIYCKMWKKKMLNEGNHIHNFISSSGSGTEINYCSGSDFLTSSGFGSTTLSIGYCKATETDL